MLAAAAASQHPQHPSPTPPDVCTLQIAVQQVARSVLTPCIACWAPWAGVGPGAVGEVQGGGGDKSARHILEQAVGSHRVP